MSDAIQAAIITGSVQIVMGLLTVGVAIAALSSWRRNALGTRQVELAEQCLQAVWQLDDHIRMARRLLPPGSLAGIKSNARASEFHAERHVKAQAAMKECLTQLKELKALLMLSGVYLGDFPRTRMPHTARLFKKMAYNIEEDFDEIVRQLLVCLMNISPEHIHSIHVTEESVENFDKSAEMFHGFAYEYEEDDYSVRLRVSRVTFERHLSRVLRRRRLPHRFFEKVINAIVDRYDNKFKPVTINKKPLRKFLEERAKGKLLE